MERKTLISEYRHSLCDEPDLVAGTQGVVVLSADSVEEVNVEDEARIIFGVEMIKNMVSERIGCEPEDVSENDILSNAPPLILNVEDDKQLTYFESFVEKLDFPKDKVVLIGCGKTGVANSMTQIEALQKDFGDKLHLTIITSAYHVPRVARTAKKYLDTSFDVIGVPYYRYSEFDVFSTVRGEIRKIQAYSASGDIAENL
jgi:uncharacterized SAM-binding protein YcdF (DUF218 family)